MIIKKLQMDTEWVGREGEWTDLPLRICTPCVDGEARFLAWARIEGVDFAGHDWEFQMRMVRADGRTGTSLVAKRSACMNQPLALVYDGAYSKPGYLQLFARQVGSDVPLRLPAGARLSMMLTLLDRQSELEVRPHADPTLRLQMRGPCSAQPGGEPQLSRVESNSVRPTQTALQLIKMASSRPGHVYALREPSCDSFLGMHIPPGTSRESYPSGTGRVLLQRGLSWDARQVCLNLQANLDGTFSFESAESTGFYLRSDGPRASGGGRQSTGTVNCQGEIGCLEKYDLAGGWSGPRWKAGKLDLPRQDAASTDPRDSAGRVSWSTGAVEMEPAAAEEETAAA